MQDACQSGKSVPRAARMQKFAPASLSSRRTVPDGGVYERGMGRFCVCGGHTLYRADSAVRPR
jgi:hypothetical protein